MLHLRLPHDLHVLPAVHQTRRGQPGTVRLPVQHGESAVAHVVHVPVGAAAAVQKHVRREETDDLDCVSGMFVDIYCDLLHPPAHGAKNRFVGVT